MPEKKPAIAPSKPSTKPENDESALVSVAKTIGQAAGKLAVKTGTERTSTPKSIAPTPPSKKAKFPAKNKQRLPRREKKALQKSTASRL